MKSDVKKKNYSIYMWFAFAIVLVAVFMTIAISGAWFTDTESSNSSQTMSFGKVSLNATAQNVTSPYSSDLLFTPTELLPNNNSTVTRTLTIANNGTVSFYTRFSISITIDGNDASSLITLTAVETSGSLWRLTSGKYVYCTTSATPTASAVAADGSVVATLSFVVSGSFGNAYANKTVVVSFSVDAVQTEHNSALLSEINWVN